MRRIEDAYLLMPYHVPLEDFSVKGQLTDALEKENYRQVIETDILDKSKILDSKKSQKFVERIARTIFLYSLIGAVRRSGATLADMKLSICNPSDDPSYVNEIIQELDQKLWYINTIDGQYYIDTEPNIYKIIEDYKNEIGVNGEVKEEIYNVLEDLSSGFEEHSSESRVYLWDPNAIADNYSGLKIFVVNYNEAGNKEDILVHGAIGEHHIPLGSKG